MLLATAIALLTLGHMARAKDIACPPPPAQYTKDVSVDTKAEIGKLGKLSAGELVNQTRVVTQPLLDKAPNQDRIYLEQSLISMFCQIISATSLPDDQKMDRLHVFTLEVLSFHKGGDPLSALPAVGPAPPVGRRESAKSGSPSSKVSKVDPDLVKYVDLQVHGSRDKKGKNIAFRVLHYDGVDVQELEGAAQRALQDRGLEVMPLFKPRFVQDEIATNLFAGSASVANRLQLGERCDKVLLARLKLAGPVDSLNGLYITHWILTIHVISPETGEVTSQREIDAKGAGTSAEASREKAVHELAESVEEIFKLWSWT
jgi:hypothetical protein